MTPHWTQGGPSHLHRWRLPELHMATVHIPLPLLFRGAFVLSFPFGKHFHVFFPPLNPTSLFLLELLPTARGSCKGSAVRVGKTRGLSHLRKLQKKKTRKNVFGLEDNADNKGLSTMSLANYPNGNY